MQSEPLNFKILDGGRDEERHETYEKKRNKRKNLEFFVCLVIFRMFRVSLHPSHDFSKFDHLSHSIIKGKIR
jgi:hypothetical protein